jgi:hypothetical protein
MKSPSTLCSTTQVCKLGYGGYCRDLVAFTPSLAASPFHPTACSIPGLRCHMMLLFYLASFFFLPFLFNLTSILRSFCGIRTRNSWFLPFICFSAVLALTP